MNYSKDPTAGLSNEAAVAMIGLTIPAHAAQKIIVGSVAPDFELTLVDGRWSVRSL